MAKPPMLHAGNVATHIIPLPRYLVIHERERTVKKAVGKIQKRKKKVK